MNNGQQSKSYAYGKQSISDDDIKAVVETLKSDWMTQGPAIQKFESALNEKHVRHTI